MLALKQHILVKHVQINPGERAGVIEEGSRPYRIGNSGSGDNRSGYELWLLPNSHVTLYKLLYLPVSLSHLGKKPTAHDYSKIFFFKSMCMHAPSGGRGGGRSRVLSRLHMYRGARFHDPESMT